MLEAKFGEPRKAALTWKPQNTVAVDDETGEKLLKLMDLLNEHDDVQNVYANFEMSDALRRQDGRLAICRCHARPLASACGRLAVLFMFRLGRSGAITSP